MATSAPRPLTLLDRQLSNSLLLASVWFGLCSGLAEVVVLGARKFWRQENLLVSIQAVWMVPAIALTCAFTVAVVLAVLSRIVPRRVRPFVVTFLFGFVALLGPLFATPRLYRGTALLLAAGIATQAARMIAAREAVFVAFIRRTARWLVALALALAVGVNGWQMLSERAALAALTPARQELPNVLVVVLDSVRAESLSLHGHPRPTTPQLERIARAGSVFTSALATAPWTLPSHASMFTGRWPHELSADWTKPLDGAYPTLAEVLKAQGYVTGGFVANLIFGSRIHGLDRGFMSYHDFPTSLGQAVLSSSVGEAVATVNRLRRLLNYHRVLNRKTAADVNAEFFGWLSHTDRRPFFAFLNYMDAHEPYLPPREWEKKLGAGRGPVAFWHTGIDAFRPGKWEMTADEVEGERAEYEAAIAYMDDQVGKLFDELERRRLLDNTLVIITSDHGEQFGEHRLFGHGNSLYLQLLHVPLVVHFRGRVPAGRVVREPVTLRDLPRTVTALTGVEGTAFPGSSLSRYWGHDHSGSRVADVPLISESSQRPFDFHEWYPLSNGAMVSLASEGYHYIKNESGAEELYDFPHDPAEERNLLGSEEHRERLDAFRTAAADIPFQSNKR